MTSADWYNDPAVLTEEIRRARAPRGARTPEIPGYDEVREVARGGQGVVFKAVQRSTRRPVAIKVLADGSLASGAARRRFEREIDLIAGLKHPSIVSVYDSGTTEDERLYLVMEFIEGLPLDEAVVRVGRRMGVRETLELFATVCDAVQYAHQRGVIHRDLKPSNIRVDPSGTPHILDFGLAKNSLGLPGAQASLLSVSGGFMGSLPWASPEQASGDPDAVDVRSDVYALGVILYQLLTGAFPYDVTGSLRETLDRIVSSPPAPPRLLRAEIDDEVETILMRCLAKEPDRRYQAAGDVARDIRHYFVGEPLEARRDSAWYTVRKQLRRHWFVAAAVASFVVLVTVGLVASLALYGDAVRERNHAAHERDNAAREARRSTTINAFLLDTLRAADPDKLGPKTPVVELLDGASSSVDTRFSGDDDLREALHTVLRDTYSRVGEYDKAKPHAERAVELRRSLNGAEAPETLSAISDLCMIESKLQHAEQVEPELRRILDIQRRTQGEYNERTVATVTTLGQGLLMRGKYQEALDLYLPVKDGAIAALGADSDAALTVEANLASSYDDLGRYADAEPLYRDAMERRRRAWGAEHSETLTVINNLGTMLLRQNRLAEAEPLLREQLESNERRLGPDNPSTLTAVNNYGKLLQDLKRLPEAEAMMTRAVDGRIHVLGEDHPHTLVSMNNLASLYSVMKRFPESETMHRRVLALRTAKLGTDSLDTVISMNNLAGALREQGKYEEALELYRKAVETTDRTLPPGHNINALFRMNVGYVLFKMKRYDEAEGDLRTALGVLQNALGPTHPQTKQCAEILAKLCDATGRPEEAASLRGAAAADVKPAGKPDVKPN